MIEIIGVGLMLGGLALSASKFRQAMQAARGEGPLKLAPLSWSYWTGLLSIVVGAACQLHHKLGYAVIQ
jgi:hypothetical protein